MNAQQIWNYRDSSGNTTKSHQLYWAMNHSRNTQSATDSMPESVWMRQIEVPVHDRTLTAAFLQRRTYELVLEMTATVNALVSAQSPEVRASVEGALAAHRGHLAELQEDEAPSLLSDE